MNSTILHLQRIVSGEGSLRITAPARNVFRICVSTALDQCDPPSYAILPGLPEFPTELDETEDGFAVRHGDWTLDIALRDGLAFTLLDRERAPRFRTAHGDPFRFDGEKIRLRTLARPRENFYGLGAFGETLQRGGARYELWNTDDPHHQPLKNPYCTIPLLLSLGGDSVGPYGLFVDNPGRIRADIARSNPEHVDLETETGNFDLWLLAHETPAELLKVWADLTGRCERPPMWSLGFHQSRWSYFPDARYRELAREFRTRRIPCDVFHFDIDYMDGYRVFTWDRARFPDVEGLLRSLREQGFRAVTIVDPGVKIDPAYDIHVEAARTPGFFLRRSDGTAVQGRVWPGAVHWPDFTHTETRERWGRWQHHELIERGVSGIWNDMNEPAIFDGVPFPADAIHRDNGHFRPHRALHNIYGLTMAQASAEGLLEHRPDERPFVLTRAAWAGVQRYSAVWTGDNRAAFSSMPLDLVQLLSLSLCGVPFVGCDIGGFFNDCSPELFARWMEWGALLPLCRAHTCNGTADQEPWSFGPAVETVARRALELRMQLLPYLYTLFVEASQTGLPPLRPLLLEYPNDATVHAIADQFLLGRELLVAPVLEPGRDRRMLYLPAGDWVHFWTNRRHEGGRWIIEDAPIGQLPLYVRAGAAIPMHPIRQHTGEPIATLYIDIFPAERIVGSVVEDDGTSFEFRDGEEAVRTFRGGERNGELQLDIDEAAGTFVPARKSLTFRLHQPARSVAAIEVDDAAVPFEREGAITQWTIADNGQATTIKVRYAD